MVPTWTKVIKPLPNLSACVVWHAGASVILVGVAVATAEVAHTSPLEACRRRALSSDLLEAALEAGAPRTSKGRVRGVVFCFTCGYNGKGTGTRNLRVPVSHVPWSVLLSRDT